MAKAKDGNDYEGWGQKVGNQNDADRKARDDKQKEILIKWKEEQAAAKAGKK